MCICLCQHQQKVVSRPGDEELCMMEDCSSGVVELGVNWRCKRKEHDEAADHCKFTKCSQAGASVMGSYLRGWMSGPGEEVDQDERWGREIPGGEDAKFERTFDRLPLKGSKAKSLKKLTKKIDKLQKEINSVETKLEKEAGHPLSKADKIKDETLVELTVKLKKKQKELREKEDTEDTPDLERVMNSVVENMDKLRKMASRPSRLEEMSLAELDAEKAELSEQLREAREELGGLAAARQTWPEPFERLQNLKRLTRRPSYSSGSLLSEIPEHSSIELVSPRRSSVDSVDLEEEYEVEETEAVETNTEEGEEEDEEWHTMTETELQAAMKSLREEKRSLRGLLQQLELELLGKAGRQQARVEGESARLMYKTYKKEYKRTKAKIKLTEALLIKFNNNVF